MSARTCTPGPQTGRPFVAALAAGAIFVFAATLGEGEWDGGATLGFAALFAPVAAIFGFVIAVVPCLVGSAALHALGTVNDGARLPAFWTLAGGLAGGGLIAAVADTTEMIAPFAITGALCALICRSGARWT